MSLKHGILGLLTYSPMSGYDLMKAFDQSLKFFWYAQTSQIYRELESLTSSGWIEAAEESGAIKPGATLVLRPAALMKRFENLRVFLRQNPHASVKHLEPPEARLAR